MLGGLRTVKVGPEVRVYDGGYFLWQVYPLSPAQSRHHGTVAVMFDIYYRSWPMDGNGTRLKRTCDDRGRFLRHVPAGPIGEYGWLLDLVQEAGLVLPDPTTHQETTP